MIDAPHEARPVIEVARRLGLSVDRHDIVRDALPVIAVIFGRRVGRVPRVREQRLAMMIENEAARIGMVVVPGEARLEREHRRPFRPAVAHRDQTLAREDRRSRQAGRAGARAVGGIGQIGKIGRVAPRILVGDAGETIDVAQIRGIMVAQGPEVGQGVAAATRRAAVTEVQGNPPPGLRIACRPEIAGGP